jgi:hypothetical protein
MGVPRAPISLPSSKLDRQQVKSICQNPAIPELFGYVCAMAWGMQGSGPGGRRHVANAWSNRHQLLPILTRLRSGGLTRCTAYSLFLNPGISGLGPAYFTKLLYFFSPHHDFYIMDQWTAKSVNLLTGNWVVRMTGDAVAKQNKSGNYQAYCEEVDFLANLLGVIGDQCEEMLMSKGCCVAWPWRNHIRSQWASSMPFGRYSRRIFTNLYPYIPLTFI